MHAAQPHFSRACELLDKRQIKDALEAYDQAEKLGFESDACASGRWLCWMLLGCFENAWRESDGIARRGAPDPHCFWDGSPFNGKHVMLRCLHGLGDAIQFIRYAPLLRQDASSLTVQAPPRLVSLLSCARGVDRVITWDDAEPHWDQQIEVMELPRAFGTTASAIPAEVPYFSIEASRLSRSREALGDAGLPKIGLAWAAGSYDSSRSLPVEEASVITALKGFSFYSLQLEPEVETCPGPLLNTSHTSEVLDTAADICNLDLVITVDTMVAHLAGAVGRPVWTLLPFRADWRWMLGREDSPWYPTMRLFRQPAPGEWRPVVEQVVSQLQRLTAD